MAQAEHKLKKIAFSKVMRGYSCDEVDTYLAYVNDQYSALTRECGELRRKMAAMAAGQNEYREDALREKEKMAAEAQSLLEAGRAEADRLVEEARHKAARLLSEAETAAAGILKEAEEAAAAIPAAEDTAAAVLEQSNMADRLVAEIDTFREEIFAMYAKHIEELERISRRTDAFYETKEALTAGYPTEAALPEEEEASAESPAYSPADSPAESRTDGYADEAEEEAESPAYSPAESLAESPADSRTEAVPVEEAVGEEELPAEAAGEDAEEEDPFAAFYAGEDDDDDDELLRIDWKSHRASVGTEPEEDEEPAGEAPADTFADLWKLTEEDREAEPSDFLEDEDEAPYTVPEDPADRDPLDRLFAAEADEDELLDMYMQVPEEAEEEAAEPAETEITIPADEEEAFLSDIASEYLHPQKNAPAAKKTASSEKETKAETMDDLFEGEAGSLTDEFELIYNSKNSADNVAQIRRQPLVDAKRPEKPKKHGNGNI